MSKHTPGPWKLCPVVDSRGRTDQPDVRWVASDGLVVDDPVVLLAGNLSHPEAVANARLIAAAPELLLAAKHAIEFMRGMHGNDLQANEAPNGQAGPEYESIEAYHALMKAIAKAEGKE